MSLVPVTGPARLLVGEPPREGSIEFTDYRRTIVMPIRGALPVLGKVRDQDDVHPSVALLAGAALMGLQLVASGSSPPTPRGGTGRSRGSTPPTSAASPSWPARARGTASTRPPRRAWCAACSTRSSTRCPAPPRTPRPGPAMARRAPADRVGADEPRRVQRPAPAAHRAHPLARARRPAAPGVDLVPGRGRRGGARRRRRAPGRSRCTPSTTPPTWPTPPSCGPSPARRRRTASASAPAPTRPSRCAPRPTRGRCSSACSTCVSPTRSPSTPTRSCRCSTSGAAALTEAGHPVMWPKYLDREVTQRVELGRRSPGRHARGAAAGRALRAAGAVRLRVAALAARRRAERRRDGRAGPHHQPDHQAARQLGRRRLRGDQARPQAADPHRHARAGAGRDAHRGRRHRGRRPTRRSSGASLLQVRERLRDAATGELVDVPAGLQAELRDYQRRGLSWLAELHLARPRRLPGRRHGPRQDDHRHRPAPAPAGTRARAVPRSSSARRRCSATGRPRSVASPRESTYAATTAARRDLGGVTDGFVLTTYGTMRNDAALLAEVRVGPGRRRRGPARQELPLGRGPGAARRSRAPRAWRSPARRSRTTSPSSGRSSTGRSPACSAAATPSARCGPGPIESGLEPTKARQFADLIGPFLLRRRKSDPGVAPELPPKTETDHLLGLTREQVVLYETLVRDSMRRIEEADEETRRGLVLKLLTGLKQICNHPAHFLRQPNPRAAGSLGEARPPRRARRHGRSPRTARSSSSPSTSPWRGCSSATSPARACRTSSCTAAPRCASATRWSPASRPARCRSSCSRSRPAAPGSTSPAPTTSSTSTAGGTRPSRTRPPTAPTGSARPDRCRCTALITQGTIEEKIAELLARKRSIADSVLTRGETALTELSDDELRDLVELRR